MRKFTITMILFSLLFMVSCRPKAESRSFAEAHDAFETKLTKQSNDQDPIPEPPEGIFDLAYYQSEVGELAAYVSSDPGDSEKHPMIIWVVGGWGNGIDEFPWSYPEWENDQTGAAFRESGILMMYPSFRGGNGNPGHYETLFGEVDDIISAYEYAASLPYVDPDRIYLGGHSTGGTRALLASAYTDKFRAVFSFGPVDDVKYHNNSEFTFDTSNEEEYKMRSPIYWLSDIKSPTFVIEGMGGNAVNLKNIERKSKNENIYCYTVDGADHFSVLAPVTRLLAQKILEDTGTEPNIALTQPELQMAMEQSPAKSYPVMKGYHDDKLGFSIQIPAVWETYEGTGGDIGITLASTYEGDNFWESSMLFVDPVEEEDGNPYDDIVTAFRSEGHQYQTSEIEINGQKAFVVEGSGYDPTGIGGYSKVVIIQKGGTYIQFWFYTPEEYQEDASIIFENMIGSIVLN